jgi:hypothetical protein
MAGEPITGNIDFGSKSCWQPIKLCTTRDSSQHVNYTAPCYHATGFSRCRLEGNGNVYVRSALFKSSCGQPLSMVSHTEGVYSDASKRNAVELGLLDLKASHFLPNVAFVFSPFWSIPTSPKCLWLAKLFTRLSLQTFEDPNNI